MINPLYINFKLWISLTTYFCRAESTCTTCSPATSPPGQVLILEINYSVPMIKYSSWPALLFSFLTVGATLLCHGTSRLIRSSSEPPFLDFVYVASVLALSPTRLRKMYNLVLNCLLPRDVTGMGKLKLGHWITSHLSVGRTLESKLKHILHTHPLLNRDHLLHHRSW